MAVNGLFCADVLTHSRIVCMSVCSNCMYVPVAMCACVCGTLVVHHHWHVGAALACWVWSWAESSDALFHGVTDRSTGSKAWHDRWSFQSFLTDKSAVNQIIVEIVVFCGTAFGIFVSF